MKQFYIFLVAAMLVCGNSVFAQQQPSTPAKPAAPAKPAVKLAPAKPARPARPARPKPPEEKPEPGDAELAELKKAYDVVKEKIVKEKVEKAALTERMNVWIATIRSTKCQKTSSPSSKNFQNRVPLYERQHC